MKKSSSGGRGISAIRVVLLAFVLVTVLTPVYGAVTPPVGQGIMITDFTTDKDLYSARDVMNVSLAVYSPENVSGALVRVEGVLSRKGVKYVSYSSKTNLTVGENAFAFTKTLPSCSSCAGISQGTYYLEATVTHGGDVVKATHSIAIAAVPNRVIPVDILVEEMRR
ncbi:MAG: hypothetical protein ACP5E9_05095, partial [Candidatus Methanospirareceae archaeon]